jgi:putative redox protein
MSVEMDIEYEGQLHCRATHGLSGQTLSTDAPLDNGGKGEAFSPTDLVGVALGTCVLTLMGIAAQRQNLDITGTRVHAVKEMAATPLRRVGSITMTVTLPKGSAYSEADRKRLEHAARTCPVKESLHPDVNIEMKFVYQT